MTVIYVLIALSLTVAVGFLIAFLWAVRTGQYDDTHTPAMRMLFDDRDRTHQTIHTSKRFTLPKQTPKRPEHSKRAAKH